MPLSLFFAAAIHIVQSYGSLPGLLPDPFFRIHISNLHMCKHGSGSLAIDQEGRFRPQQFEDFFSKFDTDRKGGLAAWEIWRALRRQAFTLDFFGQASALAECM
jgi:peroxygenase